LDTATTEATGGSDRRERRVHLVREGLRIGDETVPLLAGSVHYWRLEPRDWRACLEATKALGLRLVDVYVPWAVHEVAPGKLDLGEADPRRDVAAFLRLVHELGMFAIVRPGPHINAELTYFGVPERVVWDRSCQARTPGDNPVMLPMVPVAFPVPSYASEAFLDEVTRYFQALAPVLAPLRWPDGPIVLLQIDNEGALYFRDGAYDQDYHPDAIALYRAFLRERYRTIEALRAAYEKKPAPPVEPASTGEGSAEPEAPAEPAAAAAEDDGLRFSTIEPPKRFDATSPEDLARHLDWAEFHEHLLGHAIERYAKALAEAGLSGLPTTHNLPMGQETTPLNAARITRAVDLAGLDYYYPAGPAARATIARRTTELAVRCDGQGVPSFGCEMGAGYPPFFPPLDERDSAFTVMTALAYGLRGYNVYMAVERDRWIGAPVDRHGRARPFAAFWRNLAAALERTRFHTLARRVPVRLLTPRSERRLARVMHAFGPLTGAIFSVMGAGARERCIEDDLGLGYPVAIEADAFVTAFEQSLEARGVPFAHIGGEDRDVSLAGASWIVCATAGGMSPDLFASLGDAARAGAVVTLGPREPAFDGAFRALASPLDLAALRPRPSAVPGLVQGDPASVDEAVARAIDELALPTFACDPDGVFATVHEDAGGAARVLFVLHPGANDVMARVAAPAGVRRATDLLDGTVVDVARGAIEVRMPRKSVRMLALD
jgi:beta-galactosidase